MFEISLFSCIQLKVLTFYLNIFQDKKSDIKPLLATH